MGFHGYPRATTPFLDQLAQRGVVFERAIAQWPKTGTSFASMFLGQYPQTTGLTHHAAVELPDTQVTLPEYFRAAGYKTLAVVGNAVLDSELGWSQGFDEYIEPWRSATALPEGGREWKELLSAKRMNELAVPLLKRYANEEKLFVWIHYIDPHAPYYVLEWDGRNPFLDDEYYVGDERVGRWFPPRRRLDGRDEVRYYQAQYDANVLTVDNYVEQLFGAIRPLGLLEESMVVFTADHGEGLGQHQYMGHGRLPYNHGVHVPLLIYSTSGLSSTNRVGRPVELIDLYPTFRDLVASEYDGQDLEGRSMLQLLRTGRNESAGGVQYAFSEAGDQKGRHFYYRMVQDERWKLIYHPPLTRPELPARYELYDLENDPGETHNLVDDRPGEARRLRSALREWMREPQGQQAVEEGARQSERIRRILKGLGYIR